MTTIVNQVVTAMVDALQRAPAVVPVVDRVRQRPVSQGAALAIVVRPVQTDVPQVDLSRGYPTSWDTTITVECYSRSGASVSSDVALDPLLEATYARLMDDPTLGGVLIALQLRGVSFDFDADGDNTVCASLVFNARHLSTLGTLS